MRISNWKTCTLLLALTVGSPIVAFADATPTAPIGTMDCGQHQATDDEFLLIYDAKTGQITRPHRTLYGNQELVVCISNPDHRNVYRATATLTDLPPPPP